MVFAPSLHHSVGALYPPVGPSIYAPSLGTVDRGLWIMDTLNRVWLRVRNLDR